MRLAKGLAAVVGTTLLVLGLARAQEASEERFGLDENSVFAVSDPIVPSSSREDPGDNEKIGAYFDDMSPLISHQIEDFLPITLADNLCLDCHDDPSMIGEEVAPDEATPMPVSHYTDLRFDPDAVSSSVVGTRFSCTLCHRPQTDAEPWVANSYQP